MAEIKVGIIRRLFDLPVTEYIFEENDENSNFFDPQKMWFQIAKFFNARLDWGLHSRCLPMEDSDMVIWTSDDTVHLYVDGNTEAVVEVVSFCMFNCIRLILWHYDKVRGEYFPQYIMFGF